MATVLRQGLVCMISILLLGVALAQENEKKSDNKAKDVKSAITSSGVDNTNKSKDNPNLWVPVNTNCTCSKELNAIKRDLRNEISQREALKVSLDSYASDLQELKNMMARNSSKLNQAPNAIAAASSAQSSVAFSSKLSYNRELKPLDTVVFDTVLTNNGNAYDPDSGKFTSPVSGTYVFHATILSGYNTKVETAIIVNDKEVARIYSGAHDAHGSGSNVVIVDLRSGDAVWIRLLYQGGNHVHGYYSTFSGALLKPTDA